ncbi:unnamed protein product, partial [Brassica oleracea]
SLICNKVVIKPHKIVRKLARVQHLYLQLAGKFRRGDDNFSLTSARKCQRCSSSGG